MKRDTIRSEGESRAGLTPAELQFLRERLQRLRGELTERLQHDQTMVTQDAESLVEPMDLAEQTREQDDAILFGERDRALLREVEHALAKFLDGSYGLSEASGEPIGFRRLEAIPWARLTSAELGGMPASA